LIKKLSKPMNKELYFNNLDQKDDFSLIRDFQSGDKSAFDALVLRYKDRIFNLCFRFFGDYHEAEDSAQDVFLKTYNSLKGFRFESSFFTWLYRITINTCKNKMKSMDYRYRKTDVRNNIPEESVDGNQMEQTLNSHGDPVRELENKERAKILQEAVDALPSDQKSVVILRDMQGLSYEEITDITGFKLGTLKSKLSRARNNLREKLGGML
jgi:RNA polymerase sigma-70 factor, ECF subfamily